MVIFESAAVVIFVVAILLLDILKEFFGGLIGKTLVIVSITLHIALIFPLMTVKAPINEAVLVYMCSAFVYTLSFFIRHSLAERAARGREEQGDI